MWSGFSGPLLCRFSCVSGCSYCFQSPGVVGQNHLIVVVGAQRVAVDAVSDVEVLLAVAALAECGCECHAVDARAAETVFQLLSVVGDFGVVVVDGLLDVDGLHHVVLFGIHPDAVDAVDVEDCDVETRLLVVPDAFQFVENALSDRVVLVLDRSVEPSVVGIERHAAQVPGHAFDAAEQVTLHVGFQERGGEREVHVAAVEIDGDALYVERALFARIDLAGQFGNIDRHLAVRISRRAGREQRHDQQNGNQSFENHVVNGLIVMNLNCVSFVFRIFFLLFS